MIGESEETHTSQSTCGAISETRSVFGVTRFIASRTLVLACSLREGLHNTCRGVS